MVFLSRAVLICLAGVMLGGCASSGHRFMSSEEAHHNFAAVLATVEKNFVDEVAPEKLVSDAIDGMYLYAGIAPLSVAERPPVAADGEPLARFSQAYDYLQQHTAESQVGGNGQVDGGGPAVDSESVDIGLLLAKSDEWIRIARVMPGSAAELAGLNRGDAIIAINGQPTAGRSLSWCYLQLRGAEGSVVVVSVNSEEGELTDYRIVRFKEQIPLIVKRSSSSSTGA